MKKAKIILAISLFGSISGALFAQNYHRDRPEYEKMEEKAAQECSESEMGAFDEVYGLIDNLKSDAALEKAQELAGELDHCFQADLVLAEALFNAGKRLEAVDLIDSLLARVGPRGEVIYLRGEFALEMGHTGPSSFNKDGSTIYQPSSKGLPYEEAQFKMENFQSALHDFDWLIRNFDNSVREIGICAYLAKELDDIDRSNSYLEILIANPDYADQALEMMIDNYLSANRLKDAEQLLNLQLEKDPRSAKLNALAFKLYNNQGDEAKALEYRQKAEFYDWIGAFNPLPWSENARETLVYFMGEASGDEKKKRLKAVKKEFGTDAGGIYAAVLNLHANHGNGVEELASELLAGEGNTAVPLAINLMQYGNSTCTHANAAFALAEIGDDRAWEPMTAYLERIHNMPMTLIPPDIPGALVKFDADRALPELLKFASAEYRNEIYDNPDGLSLNFSRNAVFSAIENNYSIDKIKDKASEMGMEQAELDWILEKIK